MKKDMIKNEPQEQAPQSWIEAAFESTIWGTRFFVLLAVVFSMIGGIALFIVASVDVWHVAVTVSFWFGFGVSFFNLSFR